MTAFEEADEATIEAALEIKQQLREQAVDVSCSNPSCSNTIPITAKQKRDFLVSYRKLYGKTVFPCCCNECRDVVFNMML